MVFSKTHLEFVGLLKYVAGYHSSLGGIFSTTVFQTLLFLLKLQLAPTPHILYFSHSLNTLHLSVILCSILSIFFWLIFQFSNSLFNNFYFAIKYIHGAKSPQLQLLCFSLIDVLCFFLKLVPCRMFQSFF